MNLPKIVSNEEWLAAQKDLLAKEKGLTKQRDALAAVRRKMPMVEVEKDYDFEGPDGRASLRGVLRPPTVRGAATTSTAMPDRHAYPSASSGE